jgi:hypothetical protein
VFHFFAHKLACLSGRRLAFALIFARAFNYIFFWHNKMISPLERCLAVNNKEAGATSRRFVVSKEPVLSSAWLTAILLTATLFFALAPLTFTFFSLAILLSALLSGAGRWKAIWTETHNRAHGWLPYQAKSYRTSDHVISLRLLSFAVSLWQRRASF